jgi:uncharacterized membrane-anchored protein
VQVGTSVLHFAGLLASGGFAIATDRTVWRARRGADAAARRRVLGEIASVHRPVLIGLAVVFVTGAMLTFADAETYLASPTFWTKMGLVALLLANGAWLGASERRLAADPDPRNPRWRALLAASTASATLWLSVLLAGVLLTNG